MAAVQSLHQVILGGYAGEITEQQEKFLLRAGERIKGLVSQIDDIFDMSRIESHVHATGGSLYLSRVAQVTPLENARPQAAEKKIDLVADWNMNARQSPESRPGLQQALSNLLGNAIKFTQSGGKVTLRITMTMRRVNRHCCRGYG